MESRDERPFGCAAVLGALRLALAIGASGLWFATASAALADNSAPKEITVASTGTGSYICSPAGFGQKSRCMTR